MLGYTVPVSFHLDLASPLGLISPSFLCPRRSYLSIKGCCQFPEVAMSPFENITTGFVGIRNSSGPYFYATLANLRLDAVGFLAILGESSMLEMWPIAARSKIVYLPRLIPAPQAFFRAPRLRQLPRATGIVLNNDAENPVHGREGISFFGNLLV